MATTLPTPGVRYVLRGKEGPTGCSLDIVFFPKILNIPDSGLSLFFFDVSMCTHTRQVEHQRRSRTDRVQKNETFL